MKASILGRLLRRKTDGSVVLARLPHVVTFTSTLPIGDQAHIHIVCGTCHRAACVDYQYGGAAAEVMALQDLVRVTDHPHALEGTA